MNRVEERLRDAFAAAAETVRPESISERPDRPKAESRWHVAPLAAAAAVAVVVIGASVITSLALGGGHQAPATPGRAGVPAPSASAGGASASPITVPLTVGMSVTQAEAVLSAVGLQVTVQAQEATAVPAGTVIAQTPVGGARVAFGATVTVTVADRTGSSATFTLAPPRLVTIPTYAVTIAIPKSWQPTDHLGRMTGYSGADGWVQVSAQAEPGGLQASCRAVASHPAYGPHPEIVYRSIGGRPGCLIIPAGEAPVTSQPPGGLPTTSALVQYRQPLSDGDNFLLVSSDPPHMEQLVDSIQLHH
ncbi:MAG TPA: PASTA domain-containing protein [Streptosporangiaceae bacterium]